MKLSKLLSEPDKNVTKTLEKLESLSGYNSEDVRLLIDIQKKTAQKIADLGLDPEDTTGPELFHALQSKLTADAKDMASDLSFDPREGVDICAGKIADSVSGISQPKVLTLKHPVVKALLRANPPKKLMRHLNYRSLESMLKRASLEELFAAAPVVESSTWQKNMSKAIARLDVADFEPMPLKYVILSSKKWAQHTLRPVTDVPLMGAVAIWPSKLFLNKESLYCALTVLQAVEILETDDFYLRLNQFKPNFAKLAAKLYLNGELESVTGDKFFSWNHLRSLVEDAEAPLSRLAAIHPCLAWWQDAHYLALIDEEPVSLNLGDNLKSLLAGASYDARYSGGLAHRLKSELLNSYAKYDTVKDYFVSQFDDTFITAKNELGQPALEFETVS